MAKKMLIDATHAEETRVVVVDGNKVEEFDFESVNKRQLAGNIYLAKVTRVEPSLQAAFVDYGGNRHGFLAFSEIHPDYYQIPVADRQALLAEERAYAASLEDGDEEGQPRKRSRSRSRTKAADASGGDPTTTAELTDDLTAEGGEGGDESATEDAARDEGRKPRSRSRSRRGAKKDTGTTEATGTDIPGMGVVDLDETDGDPLVADENSDTDASPDAGDSPSRKTRGRAPSEDDGGEDDGNGALDAADKDSEIESIADEDVADEIRQPRKARPRKYKIQEVIKVRQILLVQVVKEERGNKGAALTTYLSLAGRYCVLMPNTARGGGISRKITNVADRKKLKEIAQDITVPEGAGLIIRTAGAKRTKSEVKRDYEYLLRLWEQIRELTLKSIAPAPIYEEGNLIKRSIRDLYNREIDEVFVEGEAGYRVAKDFMKMLMPSHAKNVKLYNEPLPLFARYQVESYLAAMFNPTVQLKSGGYIVIGVTEALVAIDVNSGRATKEGSIEETALKTNLEAAEEVARQLRLRDLAGLIVIDFIDMDERKNNAAVEKRFKDKLKTDRARIQVGRISGFGLMEMSRQRLRPGMIEATTQPCPSCHGTGLIRSDDSLALSILRQLEEEGVRRRSREVLLKAPIGIVNFLMNQKREHVASIEGRYGLSIRVEADPFLISPDFSIEKFKTATRVVAEVPSPVVSIDMSDMPDAIEEDEIEEDAAEAATESSEAENRGAESGDDEGQPKKRRRRRRRRRGGRSDEQGFENGDQSGEERSRESDDSDGAEGDAPLAATTDADPEQSRAGEAVTAEAREGQDAEATAEAADAEEAPRKKRTRAPRRRKSETEGTEAAEAEAAQGDSAKADAEAPEAAADEAEKPKRAPRKRAPRKKKTDAEGAAELPEVVEKVVEDAAEKPAPKPRTRRSRAKPKADAVEPATPVDTPEPVPAEAAAPMTPGTEPAAAAMASAEAVTGEDTRAEPEISHEDATETGAVAVADEKVEETAEPASDRPKRRGWWSLGR
ncbi:ribonuclease [Brevirhabdus pacifica]|uniref:Ribonuclease E n=2 Tax=Brevirhabdus pacifica TaxID=1267768 RepID=A0A1U7DFJ9_9RHOB|nr:ribonuclease E/G [Brevirhabdus pacifica]APX88774.1 ribonuclease [Brevirhabdus pacifica]OWU80027.1 ribonuclease [Loktanella sp. 22II-4b]PJJ86699.1 RNAse E [Brevirhabdus pacifica]